MKKKKNVRLIPYDQEIFWASYLQITPCPRYDKSDILKRNNELRV